MIERLRPSDIPRLRGLLVRALEESPDAFGSTLLAANAGMVREAPHTEDARAGYSISLWVAPEERGRGIGAAFVNTVIGCAHHRSRSVLPLDVALHNPAARRQYERLGFQATGRRSRLPAPRAPIKVLEMALTLTTANPHLHTERARGRCDDERDSRAP
jgi:GNAT superfamily N-acetyltransferase